MRGYKGMNADMQCRGMQYEIGKAYHADGDIEVCSNGLHFCENLIEVFNYYRNKGGNRFFEVEASGVIKTWMLKSAASDLLIIRELTDIDINRALYGNGKGYGYVNACNGKGDGYGDGYGDGCGNGYNGYDNGNGSDYGYGYYNGFGSGFGYSYGDHDNIQKILMFS